MVLEKVYVQEGERREEKGERGSIKYNFTTVSHIARMKGYLHLSL